MSPPIGTQVWVADEVDGYVIAKIISTEARKLNLELPDGKTKLVSSSEVYLINPETQDGVPDHTQLTHLHEPALLHNIKTRFLRNEIYTYTAYILIAVNPYKDLDIYGKEFVEKYQGKPIGRLPPHIFALADRSYRAIKTGLGSQSVIVSGESGSGKTESSKYVIRYLTSVGGKSGTLERKIVEANPIMEAFGNAKTVMNNNSSRFGKFTLIHFDEHHHVAGASIDTYLLEKSRIVNQQSNERNYHIFYYLCTGATEEERESLHLEPAENFHYLRQGDCFTIPGVSDKLMFKKVKEAMELVGINGEEQLRVFSVLSGCLHIGNIAFSKKGDAVSFSDPDCLDRICELLQCDKRELSFGLTSKKVVSGRRSVYTLPLKYDDAINSRDALVKAIYSILFDWLIQRINDSLKMESSSNFIGILDIFGFEAFDKNSFEQLCINHANEKLQQYFTLQILVQEQEIYEKEGIRYSKVTYADNQNVIELIEGKEKGIFTILDEECRMPKATSKTFSNKVHRSHEKHERLYSVRRMKVKKANSKGLNDEEAFVIKHFAGEVVYTTEGFLEKNQDPLHLELKAIIRSSAHMTTLVGEQWFIENFGPLPGAGGVSSPASSSPFGPKTIDPKPKMPNEPVGGRKGSNPKAPARTVGRKFLTQLTSLMTQLNETSSHFVRCVKPNLLQKADTVQGKHVVGQLRCLGMLETLLLMHAGFPTRCFYEDLYSQFSGMMPSFIQALEPPAFCEALLMALDVNRQQFQLGITRLFMKSGLLAFLEELRETTPELAGDLVQKVKRWMMLKRWKRVSMTVICSVRLDKILQELRAEKKLKKVFNMVRLINQTLISQLEKIRINQAAFKIQSVFKKIMAFRRYAKIKVSTVRIQKHYRAHSDRCKYRPTIIRLVIERKQREEEERRRKEEEERKRREEEERKRREEEERRREEERRKLEEERRKKEEERRIREEEDRRREEEERILKEAEEKRLRDIAEEKRKKEEEERKKREEEEFQRKEEERKKKREEEQRRAEERKREEDERKREENERKREEDERRRAERQKEINSQTVQNIPNNQNYQMQEQQISVSRKEVVSDSLGTNTSLPEFDQQPLPQPREESKSNRSNLSNSGILSISGSPPKPTTPKIRRMDSLKQSSDSDGKSVASVDFSLLERLATLEAQYNALARQIEYEQTEREKMQKFLSEIDTKYQQQQQGKDRLSLKLPLNRSMSRSFTFSKNQDESGAPKQQRYLQSPQASPRLSRASSSQQLPTPLPTTLASSQSSDDETEEDEIMIELSMDDKYDESFLQICRNLYNVVLSVTSFFTSADPSEWREIGDELENGQLRLKIRGELCSCLVSILLHGFKTMKFFGSYHIWDFFLSVVSTMNRSSVLKKRFVAAIMTVRDAEILKKSPDISFRALICYALSCKQLHTWLELLKDEDQLLTKWYEDWAFMRKEQYIFLMCSILQPLSAFPMFFDLNYEVLTLRNV